MKKLFSFIALALLSFFLMFGATGCITAQNPTGTVAVAGLNIDPIATGKAVQVAAKLGAQATISKKPETRVYFQISANAIAAAIATGNYNPTNLQASIDNLSGNQIVSESIADALSLYEAFFGKLVSNKLESQSPYTIPVLAGLAAGIQQAVDLTVPSAASSSAPLVIPTPTVSNTVTN